jgi:hypothetical protein
MASSIKIDLFYQSLKPGDTFSHVGIFELFPLWFNSPPLVYTYTVYGGGGGGVWGSVRDRKVHLQVNFLDDCILLWCLYS